MHGSITRHLARANIFTLTHPREYAARQRRLLQRMPHHSILLIPAADEWVAAGDDILHRHHQDSIFYHLTGDTQPMRRTAAPFSSLAASNGLLRMTMLCLVKAGQPAAPGTTSSNAGDRVLYFTPEPTLEPEEAVWGTSTQPPSHSNLSQSSSLPLVVEQHSNHLQHSIGPILLRLIHGMAAADAAAAHPDQFHVTSSPISASGLRRIHNSLPHLYLAIPPQIRVGGAGVGRFRCRSSSSSASMLVHHPIQYLMLLLSTIEVKHAVSIADDPADYEVVWRYGRMQSAQGVSDVVADWFPSSSVSSTSKFSRESMLDIFNPERVGEEGGSETPQPPSSPRLLSLPSRRLQDAHSLLTPYRALKSPHQLLQHFHSAAATHYAFLQLFKHCIGGAHGRDEYSLQCTVAESITAVQRLLGPEFHVREAYIPVIASGRRSVYIHYTSNDHSAQDGEVALAVRVDMGVEVEHVPTDCTRCIPLSSDQHHRKAREVFEAVYHTILSVQRRLLRSIRVGMALSDVDRLHLDHTAELLQKLFKETWESGQDKKHSTSYTASSLAAGLPGESNEVIVTTKDVRNVFCAHRFGHAIGVDLHEPHPAARSGLSPSAAKPDLANRFHAGMLYTIEPGIYIPDIAQASLLEAHYASPVWRAIPPSLRGLGVQVEDMVLFLPPAERNEEDLSLGSSSGEVWSRRDYLKIAALDAQRDADQFMSAVCSSTSPHKSYHLPYTNQSSPLSATGRRMLQFLYDQRVAIEGLTAAVELMPSDREVISRLCHSSSSNDPQEEDGDAGFPTSTEWYPFEVIVVTARIPKDLRVIEALAGHHSTVLDDGEWRGIR